MTVGLCTLVITETIVFPYLPEGRIVIGLPHPPAYSGELIGGFVLVESVGDIPLYYNLRGKPNPPYVDIFPAPDELKLEMDVKAYATAVRIQYKYAMYNSVVQNNANCPGSLNNQNSTNLFEWRAMRLYAYVKDSTDQLTLTTIQIGGGDGAVEINPLLFSKDVIAQGATCSIPADDCGVVPFPSQSNIIGGVASFNRFGDTADVAFTAWLDSAADMCQVQRQCFPDEFPWFGEVHVDVPRIIGFVIAGIVILVLLFYVWRCFCMVAPGGKYRSEHTNRYG
eukprot:CAMPEP_0184682930 /NCGR_PEP_ID=MMETSP0312-20130426/9303_1 /TAXON_ID=31354 /ORGANISM="Compsopogon coeruleus, Strain SAG 36.94" /LENGTH=280 /DNA_ID=CAMNT_0027134913 /DNA_START=269 /DNA_END=1111 /DNA_ORIENTATION=-